MSQEYIDQLKQINDDTTKLVNETRKAFADMAEEKARASREIIKKWSSEIKNDKAKLQIALDYANEVGLVNKFMEAIVNGYCHRMCFRTYYVHEFIYNELRIADQTGNEINNLIDQIQSGESLEGDNNE